MSYSATVEAQTQVFSGSRLEERRLRRRLTQHDLASRLRSRGFGTTQTTISRWESGQQPNAAVLPALAIELDCSIGELYGPAGDPDDEEADAPLSRDEMDLYLSLHARVSRLSQRVDEEVNR